MFKKLQKLISISLRPLVRSQCLTALMSNPEISAWVHKESLLPGSGGKLEIWTQLAKEYAQKLEDKSN
jgi:hypothetical protein